MQCLLVFFNCVYLIYIEVAIVPVNCTPLVKHRALRRRGITEKTFWRSSVLISERSSLIYMCIYLDAYKCMHTKLLAYSFPIKTTELSVGEQID